MSLSFRANILAYYGANTSEIDELLVYNENVFNRRHLKFPLAFPLEPEPHIAAWEIYAAESQKIGVFQTLKRALVQLQFPIKEGISETEGYRAATRKGKPVNHTSETKGLKLNYPQKLQLIIHQSLAGAIPVLIAGSRQDFVSLVQGITARNEPKPVPNSMGACMVTGYNNWDRIRQYKEQWKSQNKIASEADWQAEFKRLVSQKHLYQDRFIILSNGPYSGVSAEDMGFSEEEWLSLSLTIRLEHECTHYFTRRLLGSMRNNLLDELIADYKGIIVATRRYRADWFLRFMGLELFPDYREGGRLENYRGQPRLSDGAYKILQALLWDAAHNLERFDSKYNGAIASEGDRALLLMTLASITLEELASEEGNSILEAKVRSV